MSVEEFKKRQEETDNLLNQLTNRLESLESKSKQNGNLNRIMNGWFSEVSEEMWPGQCMSLRVDKILFEGKSKFQDVLVFRSTDYGNVLVLDGAIQATERDEFAYQEMMAHIPLFAHPNPKRVCVIGGGDGGVLREIAKHTGVEEIIICELDEMVIDVSKKFLPNMASGFADKRVKVQIGDGAAFLEKQKDYFDVVIVDSSDPVGPAETLFTDKFYQSLHDSLRSGGFVCCQGESVWLHLDLISKVLKRAGQSFKKVEYAYTTIPTYPSGQIGFIIASKSGESARVPKRTAKLETKYYNADIHTAGFVLPQFARAALLKD